MHATSNCLSDNASTTSPAVPVSESTFQVPTAHEVTQKNQGERNWLTEPLKMVEQLLKWM